MGTSRGGRPAAAGLLILVPAIAAGGLITKPLNEAGLTVTVSAVVALASLPALRGTRWWRFPAPALLALFWVLFWASAPRALSVAPDQRLGSRELSGLAVCTFVSVAAVALSGGTRRGVRAFRWGWVLALLLTGGIGVWEVASGRHLWTPEWAPWRFGDGSVISSTFINPNNFSDALVGMLAGVVALHASTGPARRGVRWLLMGLAGFAVVLMLLTQSRGGLVGAAVVGTLALASRVAQRPGGIRSGMRSGLQSAREVLSHHRRAVAVAATGVLAVIAATFLVPALARHNPVLQMLEIAFSEGQVRSDSLRVSLIRFAMGYLQESGWAGSGAGSFEPLFWSDPARGELPATNLHNAFVELLTQYGVWVFLPYLALLIVLVAAAWRGGWVREDLVLRAELAGQLTAFALLGATASSALEIPFWWLTLANAVALAWHLDRRRAEGQSAAAEAPAAGHPHAESPARG